jgi:hypothetical protein
MTQKVSSIDPSMSLSVPIRERRARNPMQRSHDAASLADLQTAITEFENALPGWWYTLGICSVSRDASCGPDPEGPDTGLLALRKFDSGFHCDDHHPDSTMADALRNVMAQALDAKARVSEVGSFADDSAAWMRDFEAERAIAATPEAIAMRDRVFHAITDYWDCLDRNGLANDERRNLRRASALLFIREMLPS